MMDNLLLARVTHHETIRYPMFYTLGTAAKATGKSKPTIQRAIKNGQISALKESDGSYKIDPAELHRVFPPVTNIGNVPDYVKQSETPNNGNALQGQVEVLRELIRSIEGERDDLRRRLNEEAQERRKAADEIRRLTLLLTHQREPESTATAVESPTPSRLFAKLFGKGWRD